MGKAMEMPQPLEEHRRLEKLAGTWIGEEKIHPSPWDPKGGTATGKVESRMDLGGFFLISDYVETRDGQVSYRGHGVYGYDRKEKCYTMSWFDSMGDGPAAPTKGHWEGNRLIFAHQTPVGHSRYTWELVGETRQRFTIENSQDGKSWAPFMEAQYTRK